MKLKEAIWISVRKQCIVTSFPCVNDCTVLLTVMRCVQVAVGIRPLLPVQQSNSQLYYVRKV